MPSSWSATRPRCWNGTIESHLLTKSIMKPSKPTNSGTDTSLRAPRKISCPAELRELQRVMAAALFRPLTPQWGMQKHWTDGSRMHDVAAEFIKPNDRLSSFERLEIYNRQYWFRVLDCLWEDYPGLRAIVGERKFMKLITAYLARYPSALDSRSALSGHDAVWNRGANYVQRRAGLARYAANSS